MAGYGHCSANLEPALMLVKATDKLIFFKRIYKMYHVGPRPMWYILSIGPT